MTALVLETSVSMDETDSGFNILRIPKKYREENGLHLDQFLCLRTKTGSLEVFRVLEAYKKDIIANDSCAYVTTKVFDNLNFEAKKSTNIDVVQNITLGCDPEAFLVDKTNGNLVAANRFLKKQGQVGNDGLLLEFRPNPSVDPIVVCNNIYGLIKKARELLNGFQEGPQIHIVGGSSYKGLTAGFHLHFGLPNILLSRKNSVSRLLVSVFDFYVGIPSIIPEGNSDNNRRTVKFVEYGKPGGYRINNTTYEFRLPGGINLVHPVLTCGLMTLGSVVATDLMSRVSKCTDKFCNLKEISSEKDLLYLYPNLPNIQTFFNIICNPDIQLAKDYYQIVKEDVRKMIGYNEKKNIIESYFKYVDNISTSYVDIEYNWRSFYNGQ